MISFALTLHICNSLPQSSNLLFFPCNFCFQIFNGTFELLMVRFKFHLNIHVLLINYWSENLFDEDIFNQIANSNFALLQPSKFIFDSANSENICTETVHANKFDLCRTAAGATNNWFRFWWISDNSVWIYLFVSH